MSDQVGFLAAEAHQQAFAHAQAHARSKACQSVNCTTQDPSDTCDTGSEKSVDVKTDTDCGNQSSPSSQNSDFGYVGFGDSWMNQDYNYMLTPAVFDQKSAVFPNPSAAFSSIGHQAITETPMLMICPVFPVMGVPEQQHVSKESQGFTVMVRNLPNKYSREMVAKELNQTGFRDAFDFLYLPNDYETSSNKGYAFINFVSKEWAELFMEEYENRKMNCYIYKKRIAVNPAEIQGFQANYDHYAHKFAARCDPRMRPLFLWELGSSVPSSERKAAASQVRKSNLQNKKVSVASSSDVVEAVARTANVEAVTMTKEVPSADGSSEELKAVNFCPFCGAKAKSDFKFCRACGKSLSLPM